MIVNGMSRALEGKLYNPIWTRLRFRVGLDWTFKHEVSDVMHLRIYETFAQRIYETFAQ